MLTITTIAELKTVLRQKRRQRQRVALVPTMGNLHVGHLRLVQEAQRYAECVVVSLFVNPLQFGQGEDFAAYPRTFDQDLRLLTQNTVDCLFAPEVTEIYPWGLGAITRVEVPGLSEILCGAYRPGHFQGVTTVVNKLFNIVGPDVALFGQKDYQQLVIVQRMVADLALPIEVIGVATQRESDGLAVSSRNNYLNAEERARAPRLYQTLCKTRRRLEQGASDYSALESEGLTELQAEGFQPDYLSIRRADNLDIPISGDTDLVILAAAWLGKARLIDNTPVRLQRRP